MQPGPSPTNLQSAQALITLAEVRLRQGNAVTAGELLEQARQIMAQWPDGSGATQARLASVEQIWCAQPQVAAATPCQAD